MINYPRIAFISNEEPYTDNNHHPGNDRKELLVDFFDVELRNPFASGIIITTAKCVEDEKEHVNRAQYDYREQQQKQHAHAVVALNLGLHANVSHASLMFKIEFLVLFQL